MVLYGTIDSLIDFFSFTAWMFYGGAMVALIVMRYTKPNQPRPYKVRKYCLEIHYEIFETFCSNTLIITFPEFRKYLKYSQYISGNVVE